MKESTQQKLKATSTALRFFCTGVVIGASVFGVWAHHANMLSNGIRLTFGFMLVLPVVLLLGHIPALILQIGEGVSKMKPSRQDGSQNHQEDELKRGGVGRRTSTDADAHRRPSMSVENESLPE